MGIYRRGELEYLMGLEKAYQIATAGPRGLEMLKAEINARRAGNSLPAGVDKCVLEELARGYIKPELMILSTAMAWTLEKELKLPPSTIVRYLVAYNEKIDDYKTNPGAIDRDKALLGKSWSGADVTGRKFWDAYNDRINQKREDMTNNGTE